jgi:hypothetical protein
MFTEESYFVVKAPTQSLVAYHNPFDRGASPLAGELMALSTPPLARTLHGRHARDVHLSVLRAYRLENCRPCLLPSCTLRHCPAYLSVPCCKYR